MRLALFDKRINALLEKPFTCKIELKELSETSYLYKKKNQNKDNIWTWTLQRPMFIL